VRVPEWFQARRQPVARGLGAAGGARTPSAPSLLTLRSNSAQFAIVRKSRIAMTSCGSESGPSSQVVPRTLPLWEEICSFSVARTFLWRGGVSSPPPSKDMDHLLPIDLPGTAGDGSGGTPRGGYNDALACGGKIVSSHVCNASLGWGRRYPLSRL
jgi:hypothetical protein